MRLPEALTKEFEWINHSPATANKAKPEQQRHTNLVFHSMLIVKDLEKIFILYVLSSFQLVYIVT